MEIQEIGGGHHTNPKNGFFINIRVYELDVKGMYPSIAVKENPSFDTLNCTCCRHDQTGQISQDPINIINQDLQKKRK